MFGFAGDSEEADVHGSARMGSAVVERGLERVRHAEILPALLAPDSVQRDEQIKYMADLWHASLLAESEQDTGSGS